jgi:PKHD-type hydroxylase
MKYNYFFQNDVVPSEACDHIIEMHKKDLKPAKIINQAKDQEKSIVPSNAIRKSSTAWVTDFEIKENILNIAHSYNQNFFNFDLYQNQNPDIQFTQYHELDQDHYNWHIDCATGEEFTYSQRKLSFILNLTDPEEYEGGDVIFKVSSRDEIPSEIIKKKGTVIVFPSFLLHKVTPVTKGCRNSLVTWLWGPSFR